MMPVPHVDRYQFRKIVIDGYVYSKNVILLTTHIINNWRRKEGHQLHLSDLQNVLTAKIQVLVVGRGESSRMQIKTEVEDALQAVGIELISLPTEEACQEYNRRSTLETVAAALHLTC